MHLHREARVLEANLELDERQGSTFPHRLDLRLFPFPLASLQLFHFQRALLLPSNLQHTFPVSFTCSTSSYRSPLLQLAPGAPTRSTNSRTQDGEA